jgi:hypothetical protein
MDPKSNDLTPHEIFYQRYPNAEGAPAPPPPVTNNIYVKRIMYLAAAAIWLTLLFSPVSIMPLIFALVPNGKVMLALYLLPTIIAFMRGHNWLCIGVINLICFPLLLPGWLLVLAWACAPDSSNWGPYFWTRPWRGGYYW